MTEAVETEAPYPDNLDEWTIEHWRRAYHQRADKDRETIEHWQKTARRVAPCCRNCVHAGPLTSEMRYDHHPEQHGTCRFGAPGAESVPAFGDQALRATWPTVFENHVCGEFRLRPPPAEMLKAIAEEPYHGFGNGGVSWAWREDG